jgi:hypothetical protein
MKFMTTWSLTPDQQKEATARFLQTGGGPPAGVTMLGRWHAAGAGWVLAETDNAKALFEWLAQWSDLLEFSVTPVLEDAEAAEVFQKIPG